jgi:uncharacterized membrane protein YdbT with pleckstrin-like domain
MAWNANNMTTMWWFASFKYRNNILDVSNGLQGTLPLSEIQQTLIV